MTGAEKLKQLEKDGSIVSQGDISSKEIEDHNKYKELIAKQVEDRATRIVGEFSKQIEDIEIQDIQRKYKTGGDPNDNKSLIHALSTFVFSSYGSGDMECLIVALKNKFPNLYVTILEEFLKGNHDT